MTSHQSVSKPNEAVLANEAEVETVGAHTLSAADSGRKRLLDDLLRGIRLQSCVYSRSEVRAPWGVSIAEGCTFFHIVEHGDCWLQLKGVAEPVRLAEGDFVVVTQGQFHTMRDDLSTPTVDYYELLKTHSSGKSGALGFGGSGAVTRLICGGVLFDDRDSNPLLAILPPLLHVKRTAEGARHWLGLTTQHVMSELDNGGAGANEVVTRLADILFIHAVRNYFEENIERNGSGWLVAVRDQQIGRALAILHGRPHQVWTVESLAQRLAMSRSSFAARFTELVGEPPQQYCKRLRIHAAAVRLRTTRDKLSTVAAAAGYESQSSFVRAFRRHTGMTPGEYRNSGNAWTRGAVSDS